MNMEQLRRMAAVIESQTELRPEIALVLGSGLGDYADGIENPVRVAYVDIPGFPVSTVEGHAGCFVLGERGGRRVIAMQGRFHCYEGYSQAEVTLPIRVMRLLGADKLVLTNAAGGVNEGFHPGTLMLLRDHINFSGANPLTGANLEPLGPRFPDMSAVYDAALRERLKALAQEAGIPLAEGVYMMFAGPSFETPAEVRMARLLGGDAVGMSTVPEAIAANHCDMQIVGVSCITNQAAGISGNALHHQEVIDTAARVKADFTRLLDIIVGKLF